METIEIDALQLLLTEDEEERRIFFKKLQEKYGDKIKAVLEKMWEKENCFIGDEDYKKILTATLETLS